MSHIKGKTNREIAKRVYPNTKSTSAEVMISKTLHQPEVMEYLEQTKLMALKKHNITWDRIIRPVSEALDATTPIKTKKITRDDKGNVISEDEHLTFVTSHAIRLSAAKQAQELLRTKDQGPTDQTPTPSQMPDNLNLVEAQRLIFETKE